MNRSVIQLEMTSFTQLMEQVGQETKREILSRTITFPKTCEICDDKPICTYNWDGKGSRITSNGVIDAINNATLISSDDKLDLASILEVLIDELRDENVIEKMDRIQLRKNGVDLIVIQNRSRQGEGHSAFLQINTYKTRIQDSLAKERRMNSNIWPFTIFMCLLLSITILGLHVSTRK
jgi:hypothetical protein